jgi:hypothetical protein
LRHNRSPRRAVSTPWRETEEPARFTELSHAHLIASAASRCSVRRRLVR